MSKSPHSPNSSQDSLLPLNHHRVRLPVFEGPLDLLLFLIRKHEIDIYDIPIGTVTQQYLDILYSMEKMDLELTGEFFVMAATLMVIKSRMLLPKQEAESQAENDEPLESDPRWELVQQLLEYKKVKEEAQRIIKLIDSKQNLVPRKYIVPETQGNQERPLKPIDHLDLWNSFNKVLSRLAEKLVSGEIHEESVTVSDRMSFILKTLETRSQFTFSSLFPTQKTSIPTLVATFLALLELCRLKKLTLAQTENFSDIQCTKLVCSETTVLA